MAENNYSHGLNQQPDSEQPTNMQFIFNWSEVTQLTQKAKLLYAEFDQAQGMEAINLLAEPKIITIQGRRFTVEATVSSRPSGRVADIYADPQNDLYPQNIEIPINIFLLPEEQKEETLTFPMELLGTQRTYIATIENNEHDTGILDEGNIKSLMLDAANWQQLASLKVSK